MLSWSEIVSFVQDADETGVQTKCQRNETSHTHGHRCSCVVDRRLNDPLSHSVLDVLEWSVTSSLQLHADCRLTCRNTIAFIPVSLSNRLSFE